MAPPTHPTPGRRPVLAETLKAVRRRRGLRPAEVARKLGMPLRSYEYFESGHGRLNVARVQQFARALNADPLAILVALEIRSPAFAARCADNKLMTILALALGDFDQAAADDIARLDARILIAAFSRLSEELLRQLRARDAFVDGWIAEKSPPDPDDRAGD